MELSSPQTNEEGQTIEQHPNGVTGLAAENIPGRDVPGLSKVLTGFFSVLGATVGKNPAPTTWPHRSTVPTTSTIRNFLPSLNLICKGSLQIWTLSGTAVTSWKDERQFKCILLIRVPFLSTECTFLEKQIFCSGLCNSATTVCLSVILEKQKLKKHWSCKSNRQLQSPQYCNRMYNY